MRELLRGPFHHLVILVVVLILPTTATLADGSYTQIVSFGDSLTDAGNEYALTHGGNPLTPPDYGGRHSNGKVWVEQFSDLLGMTPATPNSIGGTNYAYSGYVISEVVSTVTDYLDDVDGTADPDALYTIWAGGNDFKDVFLSTNLLANLLTLPDSVNGWADDISGIVSTLHDAGARHFLVLNLFPLGDAPIGSTVGSLIPGLPERFNGYVGDFNTRLALDLESLAGSDSTYDIKTLDTFALFERVIADPTAYGIENVTGRAEQVSDAEASKYLFWDLVHPTTVGHGFVANAAAAVVVPEPSMIALLATLMGSLLFYVYRRRR